jgi:hypothetical protein
LWNSKTIIIEKDYIAINRPIKNRKIAYSDINNFYIGQRLVDIKSTPTIILTLESRELVKIYNYQIKGGVIPLLESLKKAFNEYRNSLD